MAAYKSFRKSPRGWNEALTSSERKTFKFEILSRSDAADEVRLGNADGTITQLVGHGLATTLRSGETAGQASLASGRINRIQRLDVNGAVLEELTDLDVLAGGPSTQLSFSRPPGTMRSLEWVMGSVGGQPEILQSVRPTAVDVDAVDITRTASVGGLAGSSMGSRRIGSGPLIALAASVVVGFIAVLAARLFVEAPEVEAAKARYARPATIPAPIDNAPTPARVALGRRLFNETKLSASSSMSCASCHSPDLAFTDGLRTSKGIAGNSLKRHTPTLWNMAWGRAFFWDGRASTLEIQSRGPIEDPEEMGLPIDDAIARIGADASYTAAFAAAYPQSPAVSVDTLSKAIASYQRSLVSPPTRFDRWIAGDRKALTSAEIAGFELFNGKAGCASCHSGWAFTDHGFHDVGLPSTDRGRGIVMGLPNLNHAFKTPSLRELKWTSPYMHDGSLATLDDVLRHYESGIVVRPTLSRDLPRRLNLSADERNALLAFLGSLSSDAIPRPIANIEIARSSNTTGADQVSQLNKVGQKDKRFSPERVRLGIGETLIVVNNDSRPHNVSIAHPRMGFSSGMQEPGEEVKVQFPEAGSYEIFCGVHPNMRMLVDVLSAIRPK